MNDQLQIDYINQVIKPYSRNIGKKNLLIWDQHESHKTPLVKDYPKSLGPIMLLIPVR